MVTLFTALSIGVIIAGSISFLKMLSVIPAIIVGIIGIPVLFWCGITVYGLMRRAQPLHPFDPAEQTKNAKRVGGTGKYVTTEDHRVVGYAVYGSDKPDAKVIVQMHGRTTTGSQGL